jgi:hypothetical protein
MGQKCKKSAFPMVQNSNWHAESAETKGLAGLACVGLMDE